MYSQKKPNDRDSMFSTHLMLLQNPVLIFTFLYPKIFPLHELSNRDDDTVRYIDSDRHKICQRSHDNARLFGMYI